MCDPVTAAIVLTVAASATTAYGQIQQGNYANAMGKYEAQIAERNAKIGEQGRADAQRRGEREQLNHWRRVAQMAGQQRAQFAAGNLDVNFGTPADVVEDTMLIGMEDSQIIADNTRKEVQGYDIDIANQRDAGAAARSRGKAAKSASRIAAVGTILGGAAQAANFAARPSSGGGGGGGGGGDSGYGSTSGYSISSSIGSRGR